MKYFDMNIRLKWQSMEDTIEKMDNGFISGRNIKDGYARGCGIRWGNIIDIVSEDPIFCHAISIAKSRDTVVTDFNLINMYLVIRYALRELGSGCIVEFGCARGGSGLFMALIARAYCPDLCVICFDTFEGMPATDEARDAHTSGDFNNIDINELNQVANGLGLENLHFIKGLIQDTAPIVLPHFPPVCMAHIDVDIYDSVKNSYEIVSKYMRPAGYIIFDDPLSPTCIGAFEAVEECVIRRDKLHAEQVWPHLVFRTSPNAS